MAACVRQSTRRSFYPGDPYTAQAERRQPKARRRSPKAMRRRRTLLVLFVLVVISAAFLFPREVHTQGELASIATQTHTVDTGDTLWSIAAEYAEGRDVREVIYEIKRINGLRSSLIRPGEELRVPVAAGERLGGR